MSDIVEELRRLRHFAGFALSNQRAEEISGCMKEAAYEIERLRAQVKTPRLKELHVALEIERLRKTLDDFAQSMATELK